MALDLNSVIAYYGATPKAREGAAHNAARLKCIVGGLRMAQRHRTDFDPRRGYWHPPQWRRTVAYLASNWAGMSGPPSRVRSMALRLPGHMDTLAPRG